MDIGGYQIGFAGTSHLRDDDTNDQHHVWRVLAERVGEEVMRRGHRLVTGGCSGGLTEYCVKSAKKWLEKEGKGLEQELRITSIVSKKKPPTVNVGRVLVCEDWSRDQRRVYMTSFMDSLITIAGVTGTKREGQCAFCAGTPVIPIWGTGGSSLDLWHQIEKEFATHPLYEGFIGSGMWAAMGRVAKPPEKIAALAVDLAVAMAERKSKFHHRQDVGMRRRGGPFKVFVLMPFDPAFNAVYSAIQSIFNDKVLRDCLKLEPKERVECEREDENRTGKIDASTLKSIHEADLLVADLTGGNGNVLFEYGYGLALGKRLVPLSQTPDVTVADLRNQKQIRYSAAELKAGKNQGLLVDVASAITELMGGRNGGAPGEPCGQGDQCDAVSHGFGCIFRDEWRRRAE
ncbi:MAG: hypothetical protein HY694_10140 [Deltaproteobacteria bacterium]|nr:hypothetical protein [Deltaproteobacteria bacterium]